MTLVNLISELSLLTRNLEMLINDSDDSVGGITSIGDEKWVVGFPHKAWYEMSEYYITAFKTGSYPAITVRIQL